MTKPLRTCLRDPIPEIELAASLLDSALSAHLAGHHDQARDLLNHANLSAVREWTDSLWGKRSPFAPSGPFWSILPSSIPIPLRMPAPSAQRELHARDGYYCRFCGIPVVRKQIRERVRKLYPEVPIWGRTNTEQHAAFQCMWAQYDHLVPHSRGGSNDVSNLVVTCAPCNYGRMQYTLEESFLQEPMQRRPRVGPWDGMERLLAS